VEVRVEIEHLRLVNCRVPVCRTRQLRLTN
jgi:hypothetical protein